jgi:uncharacterized membrane protein
VAAADREPRPAVDEDGDTISLVQEEALVMRQLQGRAVRRQSRPAATNRPTPSGSHGMSVGRLEAFSDGVLAIVITLLILDIRVPNAATGHLGRELVRMWPHYTAYLLSFLVVGIIWLNHHAVVQLLARTNYTAQALNLLLLLSVSVLPWPTAVLSDYLREGTRADQRVSVVLYGVSITLMGIAFTIFWRYVFRHHELHRPDLDRKVLAVRHRRNAVGLVAYPLVTVLGLLSAALFIALLLAWAAVCLWPTPDVRSGAPRHDHQGDEAGPTRSADADAEPPDRRGSFSARRAGMHSAGPRSRTTWRRQPTL